MDDNLHSDDGKSQTHKNDNTKIKRKNMMNKLKTKETTKTFTIKTSHTELVEMTVYGTVEIEATSAAEANAMLNQQANEHGIIFVDGWVSSDEHYETAEGPHDLFTTTAEEV